MMWERKEPGLPRQRPAFLAGRCANVFNMPEFNWMSHPTHGVCTICGTANNDTGFVDFVGDTVTFPVDGGEIRGTVDIIICANCVLDAARRVGGATPREMEDAARLVIEKEAENEKLKDEIKAWQERFLGLVSLTADDFDKLAQAYGASSDPPSIVTPGP